MLSVSIISEILSFPLIYPNIWPESYASNVLPIYVLRMYIYIYSEMDCFCCIHVYSNISYPLKHIYIYIHYIIYMQYYGDIDAQYILIE